jgi:hypothetical protein
MTFQFDSDMLSYNVFDLERDLQLYSFSGADFPTHHCFFIKASQAEHFAVRSPSKDERSNGRVCWMDGGRMMTAEDLSTIVGGWFSWRQSSHKIEDSERAAFPDEVTDVEVFSIAPCFALRGKGGANIQNCLIDGLSEAESMAVFEEAQTVVMDRSFRRAPSPIYRRRVGLKFNWNSDFKAWLGAK